MYLSLGEIGGTSQDMKLSINKSGSIDIHCRKWSNTIRYRLIKIINQVYSRHARTNQYDTDSSYSLGSSAYYHIQHAL